MRKFADELLAARGSAAMHAVILDRAVTEARGERALLMIADAGGDFEVYASTDEDRVGLRIVIDRLSSPVWHAVLGHAPVCWSDSGHGDDRPLPFAGMPGWERIVAVGLPLRGSRQGLLVVGRSGEPFDETECDGVEMLSSLAAFALDNATLTRQFRTLGKLLTSAVGVTARTLDAQSPEEIRQILLEGLVKELGMDAAVLWEPDPIGDGLVLTHSVGAPPEVVDQIRRLPAHSMAARLFESRVNARLVRGAATRASSSWPGMRAHLARIGAGSPGVLGVYSSVPLPEYVDEVLATLSQALSRAVHQLTLHQRTQQVADSLVRELRPRSSYVPPELEVGFVYRSATRGVAVGGDFLDWFVTDTGDFGVACGDVSGKGVEAASMTAMAVYSLRAFALRGSTPQTVLRMLNNAIIDQTADERFTTLAYARVSPDSGNTLVGLAGHPPPVLVNGDEARVLPIMADTPVGLLATSTFTHHELRLQPGQSLVFVTDGVTEARDLQGGGDRLLGDDGLVDVLRGKRDAGAQELADAIWSRVVQWTGGRTADDCAIVVLRRR